MLLSKYSRYSEDTSLQLYRAYLAGTSSLNEVLDSLAPLIVMITYRVVFEPDEDVRDQCACNAMEAVFEVLVERKPIAEPKAFTSFLDKVIRRVAISGAVFARPQEWDYPGGRPLPYGRVPDQEDALYGVQYQQTVEEARDEALSRFRFRGDEYLVCCQGLDWASRGTGVAVIFLARKYRLSVERVEWLFNYAKVVYRIAFHGAVTRDSNLLRA